MLWESTGTLAISEWRARGSGSTQIICSNDDPILKFDPEDRGACDYGLLSMGVRVAGLEI